MSVIPTDISPLAEKRASHSMATPLAARSSAMTQNKMATSNEVPVEIKQSRVCATEDSVSFNKADCRQYDNEVANRKETNIGAPLLYWRMMHGCRRNAKRPENVELRSLSASRNRKIFQLAECAWKSLMLYLHLRRFCLKYIRLFHVEFVVNVIFEDFPLLQFATLNIETMAAI